MSVKVSEWRKLPLSLSELCIDTALRCGQSFRWRQIQDEWHCSLHGRVLSLKQDAAHLHYRASWPAEASSRSSSPSLKQTAEPKPPSSIEDDTEALVRSYFNLHLDLPTLYEQWSRDDANFKKKAPKFNGIRILNQDAWEALIAFICSSNNNISRISQMVHKLCLHYGPLVGRIGNEEFYDFPTPEGLTGSKVESHLRELGFGYRAKYIADTARMVANDRPPGWLQGLRNPENPTLGAGSEPANPAATYKQAHEELLRLSGVGPKVADCVCLMGLGWAEAVPVDTHVWQIAVRDYKFGKSKTKTFSKAMYDSVGDHFRQLWGKHAGWAQSVLFTANLKTFSDRLVAKKEDKATIEIKEETVVTDRAVQTKKRKMVVTTGKPEPGVRDENLIAMTDTLRRSKRRKI